MVGSARGKVRRTFCYPINANKKNVPFRQKGTFVSKLSWSEYVVWERDGGGISPQYGAACFVATIIN